jgi:hypothetical protein
MMVNINDLMIGSKIYNTKSHKAFEVIKETDTCFYIAIFDGNCSKIDYISKSSELHKKWFHSKKEANQFQVNELRRMADYIEKEKDLSLCL